MHYTGAMMVMHAHALRLLMHAGPGDSPVHQVGQGQGPRVLAQVSWSVNCLQNKQLCTCRQDYSIVHLISVLTRTVQTNYL
jgi:hypothetical protein